jgi:hypothetical protein
VQVSKGAVITLKLPNSTSILIYPHTLHPPMPQRGHPWRREQHTHSPLLNTVALPEKLLCFHANIYFGFALNFALFSCKSATFTSMRKATPAFPGVCKSLDANQALSSSLGIHPEIPAVQMNPFLRRFSKKPIGHFAETR